MLALNDYFFLKIKLVKHAYIALKCCANISSSTRFERWSFFCIFEQSPGTGKAPCCLLQALFISSLLHLQRDHAHHPLFKAGSNTKANPHEFQRLQWKQEMRGEKKVLIQSLGFFHHAHLTDMMRWASNSKYKGLHKLCSLCWYLYYFWTNDVIWNVTQCNVSSLLVFFLMQIMMISKYTSYISMFPLKPSRPFNNTIRKEQVALLLLSSSSFLLIHLSPEKAKTNRNWSPKQILNKQLYYMTALEIWQNMFPC